MLVAALRAPSVDRDIAESLTHPFHSYPARMHPATARILVDALADRRGPVVDPFCGSGTVLVEARALRAPAVGVDLNPLAVLVARAKTWTMPPRRRLQLREAGHAISGEALAAGRAARRAGAEPAPVRKPVGFDPNARNRRLASWFAPHVRRELELMAARIDDLRERDRQLADVLTACLSAILYKVSSRTSDTDDTWVARNIGRGAAARNFAQRVDLLVAGLGDLAQGSAPPPEVFELDARRLAEVVPDGSAGAIVTSPPYAGTYDYAEHQRLRFDFLALRHRDFDDREIGSRRSFEKNPDDASLRWRDALADSIGAIGRALVPGCAAALVIGDSVARNRAIYALDDLRGVLTDDLVMEAWASQHRPMLGGSERRAFGDRPKAEHVVLLRRR
jgi:SAM-dependent methyltransferase